MQPQRVTPAQYARQKDVAKSTISRQIAAGLIPTEADGLINPARADRALAKRAVKTDSTLAAARYRKLAAVVASLRDEVDSLRARADFRVVEYVSKPDAPIKTRASFVVEDGRPGAQQT